MRKLWGGAFSSEPDAQAVEFGKSIESDLTFWKEDVECSIAHAQMLGETGIVSKKESALLVKGLKQILSEGSDSLPKDVEDVHTAIEVRLGDIIGETAGKLHTARSRNDQVATSARLYLRKRVVALQTECKALQTVLLDIASEHTKTVMPGMTHQQHAQPVTLAFHMLAHFWAIQRAGWRLGNVLAVTGSCPLGSVALAGTSLPIDRSATASALDFVVPHPNALDATSERSTVLDTLHACAVLMLDLSRISQELVVWSMPEFGWVSLPHSLTTGSSAMPQKRNPDMAELIRGRMGRAVGNYVALATTMKGLMLGYNRDTQDDKPPLFESLELASKSLGLTSRMLAGAKWNTERMAAATARDFSTSTDYAESLVRQGVPFREAHERAGKTVQECEASGIGLEDLLDAPELRPEVSALGRNSEGGSGTKAVRIQIRQARRLLAKSGYPIPY